MSLRVCSLESRRAEEMRQLIQKGDASAFVAPSMREIPLTKNAAVFQFLNELTAGRLPIVVFMTGVGARGLLEVVETKMPRETFFVHLSRSTIVVRGPKPTAVLRDWGLRIDHRAPEPNSWRELLATLDAEVPLAGRRIAVQEYGKPSSEFYAALATRQADVFPVPIYRWGLPTDIAPLQTAVQKLIAGEFDLLLITSAQQIHHLFLVAEQIGCRDECFAAVQRCLIGSIGPTATETLQELGLKVDLEPSHPKMGTLVKEALQRAPIILAQRKP